jgi:hypothetical protein
MNYRIWHSSESFADFIIDNTILTARNTTKSILPDSDASKPKQFHKVPDHLKKILYLDAPDIIIEFDNEPILAIEESREAGTGHNAFQRFSRLAAAVENGVPTFYVYPEATIISRQNSNPRWDKINPLIFKALDDVMGIYNKPVLLYYYPTDYRTHSTTPQISANFINNNKGRRMETNMNYAGCPEIQDQQMQEMFSHINLLVNEVEQNGIQAVQKFIQKRAIRNKRDWMRTEYANKNGSLNASPLTSSVELPTQYLINFLSSYNNRNYDINDSELLNSRATTLFYYTGSKWRPQGDPFTGCLAAIDYIKCRIGQTFEDRDVNLVMVWGSMNIDHQNQTFTVNSTNCSVDDFAKQAETGEKRSLLLKGYHNISNEEIPRYYMHARYGSTYSKPKPIRIFSYFADAILFTDGSLWRDA